MKYSAVTKAAMKCPRSDAMELESDFGTRLLMVRIYKDMTQQEMGELLGLSAKTICGYETNRRCPSTGKAKEYAEKLGVPFLWLCGWGKTFSW